MTDVPREVVKAVVEYRDALSEVDPDYSPAFQDEYQRLWHEAAAERDRIKRLASEYLLFDQPQVYSTRWYELIHELLPDYGNGPNVPEALLDALSRKRADRG